jgi:hypothetical protein
MMNHLQIFKPNQKTKASLLKRDRYSDMPRHIPKVSLSQFQDTLDSRGYLLSATDKLLQRFTENLMELQVFIKNSALASYLKLQNQGQHLDRYDCLIRIPSIFKISLEVKLSTFQGT